MKLKPGVFVSEVEGEFVAVAAGKTEVKAMIRMNGTAAYIMGLLQKNTNPAKMTKAVCTHYGVDETTARRNVDGVLDNLRKAAFLDE